MNEREEKKMKKIIYVLCMFAFCFVLTGCGEKNIEGSLPDIMTKLYEGISEEEKPMMLDNIELNTKKPSRVKP